MKRSRLVLLLLAAGGAGAIVWKSMQPAPPTRVVTAKVERVPTLRAIVSGTGEIRAKEFVDIQAEVPGRIVDLQVREGDTVAKGDVLLRLDDLELKAFEDARRAQLGAAEAAARNAEVGVATAEASLAAERTALANARLEAEQAATSRDRARASFARKQELHEQQLIGSEEYEIAAAEARLGEQRHDWNLARIAQAEANLTTAATRVDAAKASLDAACRNVDAARAELMRATNDLSKTVIRAPLSGLITKLNVEKGERAVPGNLNSPQATLLTIADMSVIEAEIRVVEADIVQVKLNDSAEVECDATRDQQFAGTVTEIGQSPIQSASGGGGMSGQSQDSKEFKVVVRLASPPAVLRPGFTATAEIVTATRAEALVVPYSAQVERDVELDEQGAYVPPPEPKSGEPERVPTAAEKARRKPRKGVFVRRDGRVHFAPVEFGIIGERNDVEVVRGLAEGDEVISGPSNVLRTLKEWDRVELDPKYARRDGAK